MGRGAALPRVAALDGLRGAAVAGVLLFHGGHLIGGYLGVDLFFVLSGFLITSLLLAESTTTGRIGLGGFWARRARRLLPAIGGLMVGVAIYAVVFADPAELAQIRGDALATVFYFANWRAVFATQDYWALFQAPSPLQHTWSLAIEEQFYLVWPLVFVGLLVWWKRAAAQAVSVTAVTLAGSSGLLMVVLYDPANTNRAYYGADSRAAAVLLGAALAAALVVWGPVRGRFGRIALEVAGLGGVVVLAAAWMRLGGQAPRLYRGGFFLVGVAAIAVIAAAAHPQAGVVSRVLSFRPLCLVGLISYGVYLWHWPVYVVVDAERVGFTGWPLLGVRVAITFVIAIVSYVLIEQPIRHGALSARSWKVLTPALATGVVMLIIGTTLGATPAPPAAGEVVGPVTFAVREAKARPDATRVTIVGNSVGDSIAEGMKEMKADPPVVVHDAAVIACAFPSGATASRHSEDSAPDELAPFSCDDRWQDAPAKRDRPDARRPRDRSVRVGVSRWHMPPERTRCRAPAGSCAFRGRECPLGCRLDAR